MLRGKDVEELAAMKRQGMSIQAISQMLGYDRKTVRKYLLAPEIRPAYRSRPRGPGKLGPHEEYLEERLAAGVWNARVLQRELKERGYAGGYTLLTDWLRPKRQTAHAAAVRRFETPPGRQAQVDWGHLGSLEMDGCQHQIWCFVFTLGYSRMMFAMAGVNQKLATLLRMHEAAFAELGGVPEEILYDRMKTVWQGVDERGEIVWNSVFWDFARYWGFRPRLCRPYRAQTKGKVESGVKYIRRNFLCGLQGRVPANLEDLNTQLREWIRGVANQRVHGTTHSVVQARWDTDQFSLQSLSGRPAYPYADEELRKVGRDGFVSWQSSRYSVPWVYAGKQVWIRGRDGNVDVYYGEQRIASHGEAPRRHGVVQNPEHHEGIPLGARQGHKTLIEIRSQAPLVQTRPLDAYESLAHGGGR